MNIPGQPQHQQRRMPGRATGKYTRVEPTKEEKDLRFGIVCVGIALIILAIVFGLTVNTDPEGDIGTEDYITYEYLEQVAEYALVEDPIGICNDIGILDEEAAIVLIKYAMAAEGDDLTDEEATIILDIWTDRCN